MNRSQRGSHNEEYGITKLGIIFIEVSFNTGVLFGHQTAATPTATPDPNLILSVHLQLGNVGMEIPIQTSVYAPTNHEDSITT